MKTGQSGLSFGDGYKSTYNYRGAYSAKAAREMLIKEQRKKSNEKHINEDDNKKRRICREQIVELSKAGLSEEDIIKKLREVDMVPNTWNDEALRTQVRVYKEKGRAEGKSNGERER